MQHPLTEVQTMITELKNGTTTVIDLHRLSQLVEVAQQEIVILKAKTQPFTSKKYQHGKS